MELLFLGLLIGVIVSFFAYNRYYSLKQEKKAAMQAVVLKDKIKQVCKLISVEGDFSEIYHYEGESNRFTDLLLGKKKALLLINAKAHVGFDLSKIKIELLTDRKIIKIHHFPEPELLTIETDFKYYDKREGLFNPFTSEELTLINKDAKKFITDKIPKSGLMDKANKEATQVISLMERLTHAIGWQLDYSVMELPCDPSEKPFLNEILDQNSLDFKS